MINKNVKSISITLPVTVFNSFRKEELLDMVRDKALTKMTYYLSRCNEMEQKYRMGFLAYKKKVNHSKKENFSHWDDLILWEGYFLAYKEWCEKLKELTQCNP